MGPGQKAQRRASEGQEVVDHQRLLFMFDWCCVRNAEGKSLAHPLMAWLE